MKNVICDLHFHSGLKGFGAHGHHEFNNRSIWDKFPEREVSLKGWFFSKSDHLEVVGGSRSMSSLNGKKKTESRMQQIIFDNAANFMSKYFTCLIADFGRHWFF